MTTVTHTLRNFRCQKCFALLCKQDVQAGAIECKCRNCNTFNTLLVEGGNITRKRGDLETLLKEKVNAKA